MTGSRGGEARCARAAELLPFPPKREPGDGEDPRREAAEAPENFGEVQFTGGSFDYYQGALDVNFPLNKSKTVYMRLTGLFRAAGSFVDYADSTRIFVAPAFTWEITPSTSLTILTSYRDDWMNLAFPLPASGTVLPNPNGEIPISRYIGNPAHPNDEWERIIRVGYEFDHRFNEWIGLTQNFR